MSTYHGKQASFSLATEPEQPTNGSTQLPNSTPLFLYGSLMDPDVLVTIARLDESQPPSTSDAHIIGHRSKLFGRFPALIPDKHARSPVYGKLWVAETADQLEWIRAYMSSSYRTCNCKIYTSTGAVVDGLTFVFDDDPKMLVDGEFDVDDYQRKIKPAVLASGRPRSKRG